MSHPWNQTHNKASEDDTMPKSHAAPPAANHQTGEQDRRRKGDAQQTWQYHPPPRYPEFPSEPGSRRDAPPDPEKWQAEEDEQLSERYREH